MFAMTTTLLYFPLQTPEPTLVDQVTTGTSCTNLKNAKWTTVQETGSAKQFQTDVFVLLTSLEVSNVRNQLVILT